MVVIELSSSIAFKVLNPLWSAKEHISWSHGFTGRLSLTFARAHDPFHRWRARKVRADSECPSHLFSCRRFTNYQYYPAYSLSTKSRDLAEDFYQFGYGLRRTCSTLHYQWGPEIGCRKSTRFPDDRQSYLVIWWCAFTQAQFDAIELITQRTLISQRVSELLTERAAQFGLLLDDISIVSPTIKRTNERTPFGELRRSSH